MDTFEPYTIHCVTCNVELRVERKEAVGKIIACPNCKSMVQIEPASSAIEQVTSESRTTNASIKQPQSEPVPDPLETSALSDRVPSAPQQKLPQWVVLSLASVTGIAFSIGLWSVLRGAPEHKTLEIETAEQSPLIVEPPTESGPSRTATSPVQVALTTPPSEPPPAPTSDTEAPIDGPTETSTGTQTHAVPSAEESDATELKNPPQKAMPSEKQTGDEAENPASEMPSEAIPQLPLPPAAESLLGKMATSIEKMELSDIPLRSAVAILAQFSNAEIVFDHAALIRASISPEMRVQLQSKNSSVGDNLDKLLQPIGLVAIPSGDSIFISTPEKTDQTLSEEIYALDLARDAKATEQMIRTVIFPTRWQSSGGTATIRREGNTLWIMQSKEAHSATHRLLTLLQQMDRETASLDSNLSTDDPLDQIVDWGTRKAVPLTTYVNQLSSRLDSPIVLDSLDLLRQGISGQELVEVEEEKKSLADLIDQTFGPLGLCAQPMDDRSVIITTATSASRTRPLLRVYPIPEALDIDHEALLTMITERVAPDSWVESGGQGRIALDKYSAALVVLQQAGVQRSVLQFVAGLSPE
ncbi:MAG: hypothetical protein VX970_02805 [Planctomycetota bacterium]|nr:hypothetical protein [Planctomycetota bacterium]